MRGALDYSGDAATLAVVSTAQRRRAFAAALPPAFAT